MNADERTKISFFIYIAIFSMNYTLFKPKKEQS